MAKAISDEIRAVNNPAYNVPRTFISHNQVRDQWVPGMELSDLGGSDYVRKNRDKLIAAFGNFINDMSELRPARFVEKTHQLPGMWFRDADNLAKILHKVDGIISPADQETILNTYKYIYNLPEHHQLLFAHRDFNPGNVFIDPDKNIVSFIDFELAGFESQFSIMYTQDTINIPELWEYIDHLPRSKNPNLRWEFDSNKQALYRLTKKATDAIINFSPYSNVPSDREKLITTIRNLCDVMDMRMANIRAQALVKNTAPTPAIVPLTHYDR